MKKITEEQLALLNESYPVEESSNSLILPRFGMLSKDITEVSGSGKTKKIKVTQASGTFFTERDNGEVDENGKKVWTKTFLDGDTQDIVIVYPRRQLRMYDSSLEKFYSTPVYDNDTQVLPLYLDKQVVKRGTQAELQAMFPAVTLKGKPSSKLKQDTILFILVNGELHQCNLSQSSKWGYHPYAKSLYPSTPASFVTTVGSVEETQGDNTYRKMTFTQKRPINGDEFDAVLESQTIVKAKVENDAKFLIAPTSTADQEFEALADATSKLN